MTATVLTMVLGFPYIGTHSGSEIHGMAFPIAPNIMVTCYHNVEKNTVHKIDGEECELIKVIKEHDLAYLQTKKKYKVPKIWDIEGLHRIILDKTVVPGSSGAPYLWKGKVLGMIHANVGPKKEKSIHSKLIPITLILEHMPKEPKEKAKK